MTESLFFVRKKTGGAIHVILKKIVIEIIYFVYSKGNYMKKNMSNTYKIILPIILLHVVFFAACDKAKESAEYIVTRTNNYTTKQILNTWNIIGTLTHNEDSMIANNIAVSSVYRDSLAMVLLKDSLHFCGIYTPKYGMMDFREVYNIAPDDTTGVLAGHITYATCQIKSDLDTIMYLRMESSMPNTLWANKDTLRRKDVSGMNLFTLPLKAGINDIVIKFITDGDDLSFEAMLCDSLTISRLFIEGQSGNIIYALINDSKDILLTNAHQNVMDAPVVMNVHDVQGNLLKSFTLEKDSMVYNVPEMEWGKSYMYSMTIAGRTVRQPALCGKDDDALIRFRALADKLPINHPRRAEVEELLYRLDFLLHHPTRYEGDWWWQFKIPTITYQLEYTFAHLDYDYGQSDLEPNIMFVTYKSEQDDSLQHYLLARPNHIDPKKPLPLVAVVRPHIENPYHFFCCPQLARQWAINQMQAMAERYHCLIFMPEMRTYLKEDITKKSEREFHIALSHLTDHYPVDSTRIYLHANCSGGYRALRLATQNPTLFAAIGLYAPVYHCPYTDESSQEVAPENMLERLKDIPIFVHGDPFDTHSPYSIYKDLVSDCHRKGLPLTLSIKRNSGRAYNVVLTGEEAMEFFFNNKK